MAYVNDVELPAGWYWGHQPTHHGILSVTNLHNGVYPGRAVLMTPGTRWKYPPEDCPAGEIGMSRTEWVCNDQVLVCTWCGLDCT